MIRDSDVVLLSSVIGEAHDLGVLDARQRMQPRAFSASSDPLSVWAYHLGWRIERHLRFARAGTNGIATPAPRGAK